MATVQITDDELLALHALANTRGGVKLGSSVLLRLLNTVDALRAQLAEPEARLVGVPDRAAWLTIEELVYSIRSVLSTDSATAVEVARAIARDSKAKGALRSGEAPAQRGEVQSGGRPPPFFACYPDQIRIYSTGGESAETENVMGYRIISTIEVDGPIDGDLDLRGTGITALPASIRPEQVIR